MGPGRKTMWVAKTIAELVPGDTLVSAGGTKWKVVERRDEEVCVENEVTKELTWFKEERPYWRVIVKSPTS